MVKKISENEFNEAIANGVSVVDFSATWCGPCKMLAPVLDAVSEEYEGKINFYNVDVDESMSIAERYGISSVPSIIAFKDGEAKSMTVGFQPAEALKNSLISSFKRI